MTKQLEKIKNEAISEISKAENKQDIDLLKVKYLGRKGKITEILKQMGTLANEERPKIGKLANDVRSAIENAFNFKIDELKHMQMAKKLDREKLDVTMPAKRRYIGHKHPLSTVLEEIEEIFIGMGFSIVQGPEIEYDYYNFEALNIPKDHPARDTQDTFYINENIVLRTQTSPMQIRTMQNNKPPLKIISPGRVYRSDAVDATHSPVFHQIEGLVVDKNISFSDLKGTLEVFIKRLYGEDSVIRFRPHHFPFTEPSAEVDIQCFNCHAKGCSLCKGEGYIEILGCGMIHPQVFRNCNIDPEIYSGFAFGLGLERIVMRRYNINDLRLFYDNDIRFLNQF